MAIHTTKMLPFKYSFLPLENGVKGSKAAALESGSDF